MPTTQMFERNRIGFIPLESWGGGEDGDGGDMNGAASLRSTRSFLDPYTGIGGEDLREQAVERTTPEDLCIAKQELEAQERRRRARRNKRQPEVRVNGQPLEDFLAGKPNTTPVVLLCGRPSRGQQPQGGQRRRRRGRRGNGRRQ